MKDLYVLEWSKKQGFFHIQKLVNTLANNAKAFEQNKSLNDYHILGMGTQQEMSDLADSLRNKLYERYADA